VREGIGLLVCWVLRSLRARAAMCAIGIDKLRFQIPTSRMDHPLLYPKVTIVKAYSFVFAEYLQTEERQTLGRPLQPLRLPTFLPC
jgi:hypothetical protein